MNLHTILEQLQSQHGPLMGGDALRKALAYSPPEAFRLAVLRGKCPSSVFSIENRGCFALVDDIAAWHDRQQRATEQAADQQKRRKEEA